LSIAFVSKAIASIWFLLPTFVRLRLPIEEVVFGFKGRFSTFRWRLDSSDLIGRKYFSRNFRNYEPATQNYLKRFFGLRNLVCSTVLNVGANVGFRPVWISNNFSDVRFLLVEPIPRSLEVMRSNLSLNKIENYVIYPFATDSISGTLTIFENREYSGLSSAIVETPYPVEVPRRRLDDCIDEQIDLIIIDVEGYEIEVIKGLTKLILRYRPKIIVETSPNSIETLKDILKGYKYVGPVYLTQSPLFESQNKNVLFHSELG